MFGWTCHFHVGLSAKQAFHGLICLLTVPCSLGQTVKHMQIPFETVLEHDTLHTKERDLIFVLWIGCKTLVLLQCFDTFSIRLTLRVGRERLKGKEENIITVCTCSKTFLFLHLCPNLYSSFPLSRVNQNHLWVLLMCWDPEILKKDKKRCIKCHKVIKEIKAVYVRFPALCGLPIQVNIGDEQELVSFQSQAQVSPVMNRRWP